MRVCIRLEYDGTDFAGWQRQAATRTVQGVVEEALAKIFATEIDVLGASRTDAGVHAEGQVASLLLPRVLEPHALARALDAHLPPDVAVRDAHAVDHSFHPIRDAVSKCYRYSIWNARQRSPLRLRRSAFVPGALDIEAMREAVRHLVGRHDFASFQSGAAEWEASARDGVRRSTEREVFACVVSGEAGGELGIEVVGSGFLRGMVRTIAGTLMEVGRGRRSPDSLPGLLASRDRALAGPAAPAAGLTLVSVQYPAPVGKRSEDAALIPEEG